MKSKTAVSAAAAVLIVAAVAFAASAGPPGHGFEGRGMKGKPGGLQAFLDLNLAEAQQVQMREIIGKYENERERLREGMMEARKNISTVLRSSAFNEEEARKAFRKASAIREETFVMRARMMAELKAVLTPEQQQRLKDRRTRRLERMKSRFEAWTEKPAEQGRD